MDPRLDPLEAERLEAGEDVGCMAHRRTAVGRTGSGERHPVVARPALLETLAAGARVTLVSAPRPRPRPSCDSCWPPGATCAWASTGCAWRVSSRSCARPTCASRPRRPGGSSRPRAWMSRPTRASSSSRGPRVGPPGFGWQRCRSPATRIPSALPRTSRAASGRWPSICSRRSSDASRRTCGACSCERRFSSRSSASWPTG